MKFNSHFPPRREHRGAITTVQAQRKIYQVTKERQVVLRHRKFRQYFREHFVNILALQIESFRNFATVFKISAQNVISKC